MNALTPLCAPFADLACFKYVSLTTYRRTGVPVSTPVWFAERAGVLYIHTLGGKVKRIRHTAYVTIAPCTMGGRVIGPPCDGHARILTDPDEMRLAEAALNDKYRLLRRVYYLVGKLRRRLRRVARPSANVYLAIEPPISSASRIGDALPTPGH